MGIGMDGLIKRFVKNETSYTYNKEKLLWICAQYGKTEFVKYLIDKGYDVHALDDYALRLASLYGHTETVKVLLNAGADVHADSDAALVYACEQRQTKVVKVLLDAGADVHARNDGPLRFASENRHTETVKVLKDWIAKEKKKVNEKFTEDDSDPIHDMGIGYSFETLKVGAIIKAKRLGIAVTRNKSGSFTNWWSGFKLFPENDILITRIENRFSGYYRINFYKIYKQSDTKEIKDDFKANGFFAFYWEKGRNGSMIVSKKMFNNRFDIIERGFE